MCRERAILLYPFGDYLRLLAEDPLGNKWLWHLVPCDLMKAIQQKSFKDGFGLLAIYQFPAVNM
jgi:hypothetical protein